MLKLNYLSILTFFHLKGIFLLFTSFFIRYVSIYKRCFSWCILLGKRLTKPSGNSKAFTVLKGHKKIHLILISLRTEPQITQSLNCLKYNPNSISVHSNDSHQCPILTADCYFLSWDRKWTSHPSRGGK